MSCESCPHCNPPAPPDPGRQGWTVTPGGHRNRELPGGGHLAVVPPGGPGRAWFWTLSDGVHSGHVATLDEAQLAAERAAIPLLRAAADEMERGLPGAVYCEHCGDGPTCSVCRRGLPALDGPAAAPWDEAVVS